MELLSTHATLKACDMPQSRSVVRQLSCGWYRFLGFSSFLVVYRNREHEKARVGVVNALAHTNHAVLSEEETIAFL